VARLAQAVFGCILKAQLCRAFAGGDPVQRDRLNVGRLRPADGQSELNSVRGWGI